MNRRKTLKILGGTAVGVAGLVFADWKWQILDSINHKGFFTLSQEQMISKIAETIIPEGLPPILPQADAKPIGALSTGTDDYLKKVFEHCYEKEEQDLIIRHLDKLYESGFLKASKEDRERMLLVLESSEIEDEKTFFKTMKSETIRGFTTVKEVMVDYRDYKVAPGFYNGCVDVSPQT